MLEAALHARLIAAGQTCEVMGIGQQTIANALGASQSQVSRILAGNQTRWSRLAEDVCLFVERRAAGGVSADAVRTNTDLVTAVQAVWDGSATHAKALSTVIRSLAALHIPQSSTSKPE